jgi:hypothetical protein
VRRLQQLSETVRTMPSGVAREDLSLLAHAIECYALVIANKFKNLEDELEARLKVAHEACAGVVDAWAARYPADVFPDAGTTLDAKSGAFGRHLCLLIAQDIRELGGKP